MREHESQKFAAVSRRVVVRLFVAQWFRWLGLSAVIVYPLAAALAVGARLCGLQWINAFAAVGLVFAWLALTGAWAWFRRPSLQTALAYWDEGAGRHEMFISAYCFESQEETTTGEQLHLARAADRLRRDLPALPRDLPAPLAHRAWILPLAFVGLVGLLGLLFVPTSPAEEPRIDEAARARAQEVAAVLADRAKLPETNKGLTPEEEEKLKKLESSLDETAEKLRKLDNQTHRDVLAELEHKAREAEKLAEALNSPADQELSSKMLAELARHTDTTDFASAMQAKDLERASEEAGKLGQRLDRKDLALEEHKRIEYALDKALGVATTADKQGLVGKHLEQAHGKLQANQPKAAARQLQRLSKDLARARQRQLAQQRLQQLARELRNSGQQIFGRNPSEVRRLNQNLPAGLRQLGARQLQPLGNMPLQQRLAAAAQGQLGRASIGAKLAAMHPGQNLPNATGQAPIPGSNAPPAPGNCPTPIPGTGQCPKCGGQCQGQCQGQGLGQGQGQGQGAPVPGAPGLGASDGGHFAGHGSAPYRDNPTDPLAPTGTGVVNAAVSGQGPSQVRNIEPRTHREETRRRGRQVDIDFIKSQEEALAEEPLPLSRREQVLRYFTALRRQLVEHESPEESEP